MRILPALIFSACLALAFSARAATPPAGASYEPTSIALIDLLKTACIDFATRPAMRKVWLDTHLQPAESHNEKFFVGEDPGRAWIDRDQSNHYAVIVYDSGLCAVKAERANLADSFRYLDHAAAGWTGYTLTRMAEPPPKPPPALGAGEVESPDMKAAELRDLTNTPHSYKLTYQGKTGTVSGFVLPPATFLQAEFTFMPAAQ